MPMKPDDFTRLVATLHHWRGSASEAATFIIALMMLAGVIGGCLLTRWIFRGGLSRCACQ